MWQGYRDSAYQQKFEAWLDAKNFNKVFLHTSGQTKISDIRRLINGLNPKKIVPMHTMQPNALLEHSNKVVLQEDGVVFENIKLL